MAPSPGVNTGLARLTLSRSQDSRFGNTATIREVNRVHQRCNALSEKCARISDADAALRERMKYTSKLMNAAKAEIIERTAQADHMSKLEREVLEERADCRTLQRQLSDAMEQLESRPAQRTLDRVVQARDQAVSDRDALQQQLDGAMQQLRSRPALLDQAIQARDQAVSDRNALQQQLDDALQQLRSRPAQRTLDRVVQARDQAVSDRDALQQQLDDALQQLDSRSVLLEQAIQARDEAASNAASLESEHAVAIQNLNAQLDELRLRPTAGEMRNVTNLARRYKRDVHTWETAVRTNMDTINGLTRSLDRANHDLSSVTELHATTMQEKSDAEDIALLAGSEIDDLVAKAGCYQRDIDSVTSERDLLKQNLDLADTDKTALESERNHLRDAFSKMRDERMGLQNQLDASNNDVKDLRQQLSSLKVDERLLTDTVTYMQRQIKSLQETKKTADDDVSRFKQQVASLQESTGDRISGLERQLTLSMEETSTAKEDCSIRQQQIVTLQQNLVVATKTHEPCESLQRRLSASEQQTKTSLELYKRLLQTLRRARRRSRDQVRHLRDALRREARTVVDLHQTLQDMSGAMEETTNTKFVVDRLLRRAQLTTLRQASVHRFVSNMARTTLTNTRTRLGVSQADTINARSLLQQKEDELRTSEQKILDFARSSLKAKEQEADMAMADQARDAAEASNSHLRSTVRYLQDQSETQTARIAQLETELETHDGVVASLRVKSDQVADLESRVQALDAELAEVTEDKGQLQVFLARVFVLVLSHLGFSAELIRGELECIEEHQTIPEQAEHFIVKYGDLMDYNILLRNTVYRDYLALCYIIQNLGGRITVLQEERELMLKEINKLRPALDNAWRALTSATSKNEILTRRLATADADLQEINTLWDAEAAWVDEKFAAGKIHD